MPDSKPTTVVTKEELETPRSVPAYSAWVNEALARFNTPKLRAAARLGKNLAKELTDEALPISWFANAYYNGSDKVIITHRIGNQNYDAEVADRRNDPASIRYIEVTVSDRDYEESLRMEILNRDRSAAAYGEVIVKGPKNRRTKLEAKSQTVRHEDIREKHINAVVNAVRQKCKKNAYPKHTALVVRVDDATPFRENDDIRALADLAEGTLTKMLCDKFELLVLVGGQGLYLAYDL